MRLVITGASGNVGSALLRAVADDPVIMSVVGVGRQVPTGRPVAPFDVASWVSCDLGRDTESAVSTLTAAFAGADTVVHLAWQIQPSHRREQLRRVNVDGTARVLEAARRARVAHVVVVSSVGAYSPVPQDDRVDEPRDERWPTDGVASSDYSTDKAAVERLLDGFVRRHPDVAVTRVRPALVFQQGAGQEIWKYFLGPLVPPPLLRGRLPALPWPRGLRLQAVHADDLAAALREVIVRRMPGAFNIAAPDVLRGSHVAEIVGRGRVVDAPVGPMRAGLAAAWRARLVPVGPGWLDMATGAPVLDTSRAGELLRFSPRHSAYDAVAEVVGALADGAGSPSPTLQPRGRRAVDWAEPSR